MGFAFGSFSGSVTVKRRMKRRETGGDTLFCETHSRRGAGLRDADLRKLHVFVSDPARSHLRPAEAPSAQIGLRSDLEMVTPEVATKSAS